MKCVDCGHSHRLKEGPACAKCGYTFAFGKSDTTTDRRFLALLRRASANDTHCFTRLGLVGAHARSWGLLFPTGRYEFDFGEYVWVAVPTAIGLLALIATGAWPVAVGGIVVSAIVFLVLRWLNTTDPPNPELVDSWVEAWVAKKGPIEKLIDSPSLDRSPGPYRERDVYDYGVERLLIVQRPILVDWLVRNGFHAAERALLVSESGYPSYLEPVARRALSDRSALPVFLLHDSTPEGVGMLERVRRSTRLPIAEHPVVDVGLSREQVRGTWLAGLTWKEAYAAHVDSLSFSEVSAGISRAMRRYVESSGGGAPATEAVSSGAAASVAVAAGGTALVLSSGSLDFSDIGDTSGGGDVDDFG